MLVGGKRHSLGRFFYEPTILTDANDEMLIFRYEYERILTSIGISSFSYRRAIVFLAVICRGIVASRIRSGL